MSAFKYALSICGLSHVEAADFLQVSIQSVKDWSRGKGGPKEGVWLQLASLFEQMQDTADGAADIMVLDGIDPRAYNNIEADMPGHELPQLGALRAAGAMALLMAIGSHHRASEQQQRFREHIAVESRKSFGRIRFEADVEQIVDRVRREGLSMKQLAEEYRLTKDAVNNIIRALNLQQVLAEARASYRKAQENKECQTKALKKKRAEMAIERKLEILKSGIADGASFKAIADKLGVHPSYITRLRKKL